MGNNDGGDFWKKPEKPGKTMWYHWLPLIGFFCKGYPCFNIGLDIYQAFCCIITLLIIVI